MDGPYRYKSKHSWHLNPTLTRVKFGPLIPYSSFANASVEEIRERVREKIVGLKHDLEQVSNTAPGL